MIPTEQLLRAHLRWRKAALPLAILVAGFGVSLVAAWQCHSAQVSALWWIGGLALTTFLAAGVWLARRAGLERSARELDEQLAAKNRLEAAHELATADNALARTQREETTLFLAGRRIRSHKFSLAVLVAAACLLALSHPTLWLAWTQPWRQATVAAQATPSPTPPPNVASIRWKSPESETQATAVEEVPLTAHAEASKGLHDLTLEISLNGEPKLSIPIPVEKLDSAGPHDIETSLYLDQVDAQPYDIVSYYLRARRVGADSLPDTASPVQFVQVKPFRDDVRERPGGGEAKSGFPMVTALKGAQLRLMKENFLLAHADLAHTDAAWKNENARVGHEQDVLEKKTQEVIDKFVKDGTPAEIVNLLAQAKPQMAAAAQKIQGAENQPALVPQGRALSFLTEIEKLFAKEMAQGGQPKGSPKNVTDPFEQQRKLELKQRFETQAGELELLASEQRRLAEDLARPDATPTPTPRPDGKPERNRIDGTPAERQTQISQRIGALTNGRTFAPEVLDHLDKARAFARDSLRQLDAGDPVAAREPAAAAASELRQASDAMNRIGEQQAKDALVEALQKLSDAAAEARNAPKENSDTAAREHAEAAAKQAQETAQKLAEAAQKQQETGSAQAAKTLNQLAKDLSGGDLKKALDQLEQHPRDEARANEAAARLQALADRAGRGRQEAPLTPEQIAQLLEQMERMRANMQRLAAQQSGSGEKSPGNQRTDRGDEGRPESERGQKGSEGSQSSPNGSPSPGDNPDQGKGSQPAPGKGDEQGRQDQQGQKGQQEGQGQQQGQGQQPGNGEAEAQGQGRGRGQQGEEGESGQGSGKDQQQATAENSSNSSNESEQGQEGMGEEGKDSPIGRPNDEERMSEVSYGTPSTPPNVPGKYATSHTTSLSPRPLTPEARERMARELVTDLRETVAAASAVAPETAALVQAQLADTARHTIDPTTLFVKIDPPLEGLIEQLRAQVGRGPREYQLTDQGPDSAPPAYRDAVADYFERLSREAADAAHAREGK